MKKISGIIGVTAVTLSLFLNTTNLKNNKLQDLTITQLMGLSYAEAESAADYERCDAEYPDDFDLFDACMFGSGCYN